MTVDSPRRARLTWLLRRVPRVAPIIGATLILAWPGTRSARAQTFGIPPSGDTLTRPAAASTDPRRGSNSIGIGFGILGPGVELSRAVHSRAAIRVGAFDGRVRIRMNNLGTTEINLQSAGQIALLDLQPFAGRGWIVSVGGVHNMSSSHMAMTGDAVPSTINGHAYNGSDIGSMRMALTFPQYGPYFGLGVKRTPTSQRGWSVRSDIGLVATAPQLTLTALNAPTNPQLAGDLEAQRLRWMRVANVVHGIPVIGTTMLTYRF